jgi:hypothetical protein
MPYIKQHRRHLVPNDSNPETDGELNFVITTLIQQYLVKKGLNYSNINTCIGVLECAKLELYRRIASPYEDTKIKENGDVMLL